MPTADMTGWRPIETAPHDVLVLPRARAGKPGADRTRLREPRKPERSLVEHQPALMGDHVAAPPLAPHPAHGGLHP